MRSLSLRSGNSPTTPYGGRVNGVGSRTGAPPVGSSESGPTGHVSSPRLVKRSMRISRTTLSCLLRVKGYVAVRVGSAFRAAHSSRVLLHLFQPCPQCFRWVQPSPSRISSVSGPAVSAPLSSRLCLPCCQSHYRQRGRFPPPALPGFPGTTNPSATLSPVRRLPGAPGYTAYLCSADFSPGRGGLLQLLSASSSPCRRYHPAGVP